VRWFVLISVFLGSLVWVGCTDANTVCNEASDCPSCDAGFVPFCDTNDDECGCDPVFGSGGTGGSAGNSGACADPPENRFEVIADDAFADDDWEYTESHKDGATVATEPTVQVVSGGVDDSSYRSMTHEITNPDTSHPDCSVDACSFGLVVSHEYKGETYDPGDPEMGPIAYIDYSESHIITEPSFEGAAVAWTFALWQDGNRYLLPTEAFGDLEWTSVHRCGLTAADFTPAEPPLNLEDGGPITFGYVRSNTNTQPGATQTNVHGIDDFRVVIVRGR